MSIKKLIVNNSGALLLEVLIAAGIGAVIIVAFSQLGTRALRDTGVSSRRAQLTRLTQQGLEAVRSIRDQNIKGAFADNSCTLVVNPLDPTADQPYCNEWVDVWKWNYSQPKEFRLIPPGSTGNPNTYWMMTDNNIPESVNNVSRKVIIAETTPPDPTKIKKITVVTYFLDATNLYESKQETLLRKLPGT